MKKLCLHDIKIHANFHQNRSIKECARMILALEWSYMTLDDLSGHTSFHEKFRLHNVNILESFLELGVKQKYFIYYRKR